MSASTEYATVREGLFYEQLDDQKVRCLLCERLCEIGVGSKGHCKTRVNHEGRLFTVVYGDVSTIESRPIEIKPFFHYWPGSSALTFSTWSCNLSCGWCQNYHLSKVEPDPSTTIQYPPEKIVEMALYNADDGLCASFQEPTLLSEWALDVFKLGKSKGLKYCCYVSNGYMTEDVLKALCDAGLDGLKIDVKGDTETYKKYCGGADVEKVWRNASLAKRLGVHVEIVNLVVTGVNDSEHALTDIIGNHLKSVGAETPLHFTRYFPAYKFESPPTRVDVLEKACEMARGRGVQYVYVGNVEGNRYENTFCPGCGFRLIGRFGWRLLSYDVTDDKKCPKCGLSVPIAGRRIVH